MNRRRRRHCLALFGTLILCHNEGTCSLIEGRFWSHASRLAFAAGGGFGTTPSGSKPKNKSKSPPGNNKKRILHEPPVLHPESIDLSNPQARMHHVEYCIQRADVSSMTTGTKDSTDPNSICCVDNFLGPQLISAMRSEAESLLTLTETMNVGVARMVPSQSTRWDEPTQSVVAYEKVGVLSTQIEGGPEGYAKTPYLVEYIVTLTKHLSEKINAVVQLPEYRLSGNQQTNKLAVCLGGGSKYDKHIDNLGHDGVGPEGDRRKMTALLYLQPSGSHADDADEGENDPRGGYFRAYDVPDEGQVKVIAPRGDRLVLFWSDSLVHDVSPSFAPNGDSDRRWALTVWFVTDEGGTIRATDSQVAQRHFGLG